MRDLLDGANFSDEPNAISRGRSIHADVYISQHSESAASMHINE